MWVMRKQPIRVAALTVVALLATSAPAGAEMVEIGKIESNIKPGCPAIATCFAVGRTTGYQTRVGSSTGTVLARKSGRIVAWTIALGDPTKKQISFFDAKLGEGSKAQITVLRRSTNKKKKTTWVTVAQGESRNLEPYFGKTVTFALTRSIPIKKDQLVALTIPTWAPALANGLSTDVSWRASRTKAQCEDNQGQTAQTDLNKASVYDCLYKGARLTYSAYMIPTPSSR